ncbi:MAG: uracil-DNA glycosylase, partial [Candidatus Binatia bacterium]
HIVFGVGNPRAKLMFVGEGPGQDEDLQGEPFVGRAGHLLTDIITKGMGLKREDVYICNVVKCRPPENRNPEPAEVSACEPFLKKQIDIVRPQIIVGLGKFAVQTLLNSKAPIGKLRGTWARYHGIKLMPTFHPAYLLRNPVDKKLVWEDIKLVIKEMRGEDA